MPSSTILETQSGVLVSSFQKPETAVKSVLRDTVNPSMTEGFDFSEDLARWQIIAKVPYPSLGDAHVVAKKDQDEEWYILEVVKTIVQASGRVVRSEKDKGVTYILDSDFERVWRENQHMFPKWWSEAVVWPKSKK